MIPAGIRIFVCTEAIDMRGSFERLTLAAREKLGHDPLQGGLFVFVNKRSNRLKLLWFERNGLCILYKRLHRALFRLPPPGSDGVAVRIDGAALAKILEGVATTDHRGTAAA